MDVTQRVLSDIVVYNKYAKYKPELKRRETWDEIVDRYLRMMLVKYGSPNDLLLFDYYPRKQRLDMVNPFSSANAFSYIGGEIIRNGEYIYDRKVLMSMRAAQFAGKAIEKNEARIYNCAFAPIDHPAAFSEIMFLLLGGTGMGYSVQFSHVAKLPEIKKPKREQKFLIGDSIEGWADAVKALMYSYFGLRATKPRFDFSDIRKKGERLVTAGGKAPGPEPLKECLFKVEQILERKQDGDKLTSLEVHDIVCHIAHAVLAGGIRRAALIALFSADDQDMVTSKSGAWWELNPQRGRANNSAVLLRHRVDKDFFLNLWKKIEDSNAGEPGIYFSNDQNWGTNPCCEIALRSYQFCNLTEISGADLEGQKDLNNRAEVAAFFGTLQAGFTDFHYLRPIWKSTTEKDALIGVGITGICNGDILDLDLAQAEKIVDLTNKIVSKLIGINEAARKTTIKPSGTTSCVLGTSSGIHAWHSKYYIRNIQCAVGDDLYNYFSNYHPELIKVMDLDPKSAVIGIPQKAPDHAILREQENAITMLERVFKFYDNWVKPGSKSGANTNNVSATVYMDKSKKYLYSMDGPVMRNKKLEGWFEEKVLDEHPEASLSIQKGGDEWYAVGEYLWENRHKFNGMSCLPYDGGSYSDQPFIEITEEEFLAKVGLLTSINLGNIKEEDDYTTASDNIACGSGGCEIV